MIVDLHSHYPMHLLPRHRGPDESLRNWREERFRAMVVRLVSKFANYQGPEDEPGVTVELLREGGVGVALSMLYSPFDEIDLDKSYGSPPDPAYFGRLLDQLQAVEDDISGHHGRAEVAHDGAALERCLRAGTPALIHAVEGGFHLGAEPDQIAANVSELAARGVAYITVAHLFWRGMATNAPAIPFLPDWLYRLVFPQPKAGLSALGTALVDAMVRNHVLVDVTHMSEQSLTDTFAMLDERDPARSEVTVIATHMACRLGTYSYSLPDESIHAVAERGGVLGVINCQHFLRDRHGARAPDETAADSLELICAQIDHIAEVTGSFDHAAVGTDLDGYIKPALVGFEHSGKLAELERGLIARYGAERAAKVCSGNALRVLRRTFAARSGGASA